MSSEALWGPRVLARRLGSLLLLIAAWAATAPAWGAEVRCRVREVRLVATAGGGGEVVLRTSHRPEWSARVAQQGLRVIVDLRDAMVAGADPAIVEPQGVVGGVMTQEFVTDGARTTRVLVQLLQPATYRVMASGDGLRIFLTPSDKTGPAERAASPAKDEGGAEAPGRAPRRVTVGLPVRDVRFEHGRSADRVVLELEGDASHTAFARSPTRSVLELRGVELPRGLERQLDVAAFGGPVRAVATYRRGEAVVVDVDHASGVSGVVVRRARALHYVFQEGRAPASLTGVAADGRAARRVQTVGSEADLLAPLLEETGVEPSAPAAAPPPADGGAPLEAWTSEPDRAAAFLPTGVALQPRRFTGRRVDLDFKDADIHNVLRILADVGKVNIVTADEVTGAVTIRMNNVPWDQALDTILQAKKLGMVRKGNIIRIAPMADLNKERELAIARRKSELELAPLETRLIPISYAAALDLQVRAKELLSPRGSIAVDERTNVIIARDVTGNLNQVEELVRALDTQTPQVLIEARIVEATSTFTRDVGIQWGGDVVFGPATGNETGLAFPSSIGIVGGAADEATQTGGLSPNTSAVPNPNFAVNLPATVGQGQGGALGLTFGSIDNTVNLNVRLSAAEANGMVRIVSSPRVLTLDNSDARIRQGTLIPFSQVSAQGVQTIFQEANLQLLVTPHVTADGSVSMHVRINRDEPDFNQTSPRGDPTILRREAETDLLVRDGHTAVIGGIYTRNTGRNVNQVPLLGDIPILGVLFQRRRASDSRSELIIFLTPRIVNRAESLGR
jgi:type IV pilus assembly protein PilQ